MHFREIAIDYRCDKLPLLKYPREYGNGRALVYVTGLIASKSRLLTPRGHVNQVGRMRRD